MDHIHRASIGLLSFFLFFYLSYSLQYIHVIDSHYIIGMIDFTSHMCLAMRLPNKKKGKKRFLVVFFFLPFSFMIEMDAL